MEKFVQKYITDCRAEPEYDFDSDHLLLQTILCTPRTRTARRCQKLPPTNAQPDIKALHNPEITIRYVEVINNRLTNKTNQQVRPTEISKRVIGIVNSVAMELLPPKSKKTTDRQLWKNDEELNQLIEERANLHIGSQQYKNITKNIKKRVNWLRNEELRIEAEEINEYANNRQIEELFRRIKADNSTFKKTTRRIGCDPHKLKQHFVNHDVNRECRPF